MSAMRLVLISLILAWSLPVAAQSPAKPGQFDYYLLSLSWTPQFCAAAADRCGGAEHRGFVVHGLWPETETGGFPLSCRPAGRVPDRLVERMLAILLASVDTVIAR